MNLLIITPLIPYPLHSGGNRVQFNMIDSLRKHISISLLVPANNQADKQNIEILKTKWPDVTFYIYDNTHITTTVKHPEYYKLLLSLRASLDRKIARLLRKNQADDDPVRTHATLSKVPYKLQKESFVDFVSHTSQKGFNIIQVEFFEFIDLVYALPKNIIKVFLHHEIRFVRQEIELSLLKNITPVDQYFYRCSRKHEISCLREYDHILTFSETDKQKLKQQLSAASIFSSPSIGLTLKPVCTKPEPFHQIVFLGGANHFPNKDGLDWFLSHCWNYIREKKPDIELYIIGDWRKSIVENYLSVYSSIHFLGFVEDLSEQLKNKIMIVPIRIGSGMRIKILDGVINGCPLVTTTVGVEGIDLVDEKDCLIKDDPISFANAIIYLLENPEICKKMIENAQEKIEKYSPHKQLEDRLNIYHQIMQYHP
jgi:glycosyltransferase involved in cell wall biosynthesis